MNQDSINTAISIRDICFSYNGPLVLDHINLEIYSGEFLGIIGPNGGGKSTLLKIILGLLTPLSGYISVLGLPPKKGKLTIGYVPQHNSFIDNFPITVESVVLQGRLGKTRIIGNYTQKDREIAQQVMAQVEILGLSKRPLSDLSGGQHQRVLIARALTTEPEILILDEPTAHVDVRLEKDFFRLLQTLNKKMTIIVVSHDIGFISRYVNRVACLNQTLVCHETATISGKIIDQLYGTKVRIIDHIHLL
ncbi:metal ABC transporter ATP-binding protein [Candidatus Nitrosacidococcus tergens]|uniref:Putative metal transport system ATP-binding protein CT_416 n=1 Tax=Candidatus Nitrosacidococcus tergens TaxID=553981 RepID=A0A7G1QB15_9GAMM|nr:ABC transporter ATP-binding protein [Candidatus Nitrosacidococcus tergens]CAB1276695.1 putative metal transport system ATP-binding protein CT_416 [Candidatus Nitrosacidococcus tergens]